MVTTMSSEQHQSDGTRIEDAIETYLTDRGDELSEQTRNSHRYRLQHLPRFCDEEGIKTIEELTPMAFTRYKRWRKRDGDLNRTSLHTQLSTLRVFVQWCENMSMLPNDTHEAIRPPSLNDGEGRRTTRLDSDVANHILEYLSRYRRAQRGHVVMRLMWRCALRIGAVNALDVDDYYPGEKQLAVVHRPDQGTPLKKASNGERRVSLNDKTCEVLDDYIEMHRHNVTDDHGREPLITSEYGRLSKSSMRRTVYRWTQPCQYTNECPHERVISECEAEGYTNTKGCPSSKSPHDIRRGSITHFLSEDVPKEIVQDRCDVSPDVIDDHYDTRSESEKAEQRRKYLEGI